MAHLPGKRAFFTEPPMFERGCPTAAHPPVTIRRQGSLRGEKKKKKKEVITSSAGLTRSKNHLKERGE